MSTRRTVLTFGVLMAVVGLLAPSAVLAQPTFASIGAVAPVAHDTLMVTWAKDPDNLTSTNVAITGYRVYVHTSAVTDAAGAAAAGIVANVGGTAQMARVSGLKAATPYFAAVVPLISSGPFFADLDETSDVAANPTADPPVPAQMASATTAVAPMPDRVTGVMVTAGDGELLVSWEAPFAGMAGDGSVPGVASSLKAYHVQYRTSATASMGAGQWMPADLMDAIVMAPETETTLTGLTNGTMYDVQVDAKNTADVRGPFSRLNDDSRGTPMAGADTGGGGGTTPMPTPALPLFGILALFAGLLAAGRARLRR